MEEIDYQGAVEAASEAWWEEHGTYNEQGSGGAGLKLPWSLVPGGVKAQIRMTLFEAVVAAVDYVLNLEVEETNG